MCNHPKNTHTMHPLLGVLAQWLSTYNPRAVERIGVLLAYEIQEFRKCRRVLLVTPLGEILRCVATTSTTTVAELTSNSEQLFMENKYTTCLQSTSLVWAFAKDGDQLVVKPVHFQWVCDSVLSCDNAVCVLCWSSDGRHLASESGDSYVRIWDIHTRTCAHIVSDLVSSVISMSWHPRGIQLAIASWTIVYIWDMSTKKRVHVLNSHTDYVRTVSWNQAGTYIASGSMDHTIHIWDTTSWKCIRKIPCYGPVSVLCWHPTENWIAHGLFDYAIRIWKISPSQLECFEIQGHMRSIRVLCWNSSGTSLASGSKDTTIRIWTKLDSSQTAESSVLRGHTDNVISLNWHPSNNWLASGSQDGTSRIWDLATQTCIRVVPGTLGCWDPRGVHFTNGGSVSGQHFIRLWK